MRSISFTFAGLLLLAGCTSGSADSEEPSRNNQCLADPTERKPGHDAVTTEKSCNAAGSRAASPVIALSVPTKTIEKGKPLTIDWKATGLPASASVGLFLVREGEKGPGSTGPLTLVSQAMCGGAAGDVEASTTWDGRSVGCAPGDSPMHCTDVEPGTYRIAARAFGVERSSLVYAWGQKSGPSAIASATSEPFEITGDYDLRMLKKLMVIKSAEELRGFLGGNAQTDRFIDVASPSCTLTGPDSPGPKGKWCATYALLAPLRGEITTCGDVTMHLDGLSAKVDAAYAPGVLPWKDAEVAAHIADAPYIARLAANSTPGVELRATPSDATYHTEDGGYWTFLMAEIEVGGPPRDDTFSDVVLVRVGNDRSACVINTVRYKEQASIDMLAPVRCPQ